MTKATNGQLDFFTDRNGRLIDPATGEIMDDPAKSQSAPVDQKPEFTVSEASALFNQIFETATPSIRVIGEVANFKVNHGKWVFFDIKDSESSLGCFMSVFNLRVAIEDGMKIAVTAQPTITKWGKFSLTISHIRPVGTGSIKRAFDLLRDKLNREGLFDPARKRPLPELPEKIGVISSVEAAGYHDFAKILSERLGGITLVVAPVQVQGESAPEQITNALRWFNQNSDVEAVAILRGGGSRDDLVAFDDEKLVREIAGSRIPTIVGVGHEIDTTLSDLAADVRASTPSNAAEIIVPDRREIRMRVNRDLGSMIDITESTIEQINYSVEQKFAQFAEQTQNVWQGASRQFDLLWTTLKQLDPAMILRRGYAIVRDENGHALRADAPNIGESLTIENLNYIIKTEVKHVKAKIRND